MTGDHEYACANRISDHVLAGVTGFHRGCVRALCSVVFRLEVELPLAIKELELIPVCSGSSRQSIICHVLCRLDTILEYDLNQRWGGNVKVIDRSDPVYGSLRSNRRCMTSFGRGSENRA